MYTFQEIVAKLNEFWAKHDCIICQPYDLEKGAGTFNPATFLRCLGPEPFRAAYIEPCRRPKDGRYGTNPNRLQHYFQYQVILKPSPYNIQDLYLQSLEAIGISLQKHDIRFVHDDWESPTLGAWGLGWEVWIDGQECSQFTYFQAVAGIPLHPITGEITYGIERIAMYLQNVDSIFDIKWTNDLTYGDLYSRNEVEWSHYNFEQLDAKMWLKHFEDYEREAKRLVNLNLPIPAYDFVIKASHAFNLLDARGVISVTERASYIANIRDIAKTVAESYIKSREEQGFPLCKKLSSTLEKPVSHQAKEHKHSYEKPQTFVLEIGSEELPATFVPIGCNQLERKVKALLADEKIGYKSIKALGTPRRLAIIIEELAPGKQADTVEKKGPALEHAFQKDGSPTQAGLGFFRSIQTEPASLDVIQSGKIKNITIRDVKGTKYLFAEITTQAVSTIELLEQKLPEIILGLEFPKSMRWADLDISFARPIRWVVAIYGEHTLSLHVGPIQSSNISMGHRQLAPGPVMIASADTYKSALRTAHVLVDTDERRALIEEQLQEIAARTNSTIVAKERVIPQVLHLVEWPYLTITEFNKEFLKAPKEVLISEMVEHQKYFPVADSSGELKNQFIITANTKPTDSIRHGNRKVISARLSDGVFLYEQDLKTPLENFCPKLQGIIFQKDLGSVADKVSRLEAHVNTLLNYLPSTNKAYAIEATRLSKADLVSEMVGEFPELQGVMGKIYAIHQGKPQEVALAIDEHWMPRGEGAPLPTTACGTIVSIADKIDNLLGFFAIGLKPTSSSDPYALRRQGLGLIRMILHNKLHIPLRILFSECLKAFPKELQKQEIIDEIVLFLVQRAKTILQDLQFSKGEIEACLSIRSDDFYDVLLRLQALQNARKAAENFAKLLEVHKRCKGQIHGLQRLAFSKEFLSEQEEINLYSLLFAKKDSFKKAIQNRQYETAFGLLVELQLPLSKLFDKVKILADDKKLQTNRLALLQEVAELFSDVADFEKIQES